MQGRVAIGDGGVDLDDRVAPVVGVDFTAGLARPAEIEGLAIGGGAPAVAEPGRERLGVNGVGEAAERRPEGLLAHVPGQHAQSARREATPQTSAMRASPRLVASAMRAARNARSS